MISFLSSGLFHVPFLLHLTVWATLQETILCQNFCVQPIDSMQQNTVNYILLCTHSETTHCPSAMNMAGKIRLECLSKSSLISNGRDSIYLQESTNDIFFLLPHLFWLQPLLLPCFLDVSSYLRILLFNIVFFTLLRVNAYYYYLRNKLFIVVDTVFLRSARYLIASKTFQLWQVFMSECWKDIVLCSRVYT